MAKAELLNCPKSLGRPCSVTLRVSTEGLFGSFRPPYTSQIDGRSVARTPFRTVSEGVFSEVRPRDLPPSFAQPLVRSGSSCRSSAGNSSVLRPPTLPIPPPLPLPARALLALQARCSRR